jgi:regulator of nonsense transcripts 2
VQTHHKLQKLERRCEQDRLLSGQLTANREKGLGDAHKLCESLQKSVEALSDCLNQPVPHLVEEQDDDNAALSGTGVEVWTKDAGGQSQEHLGPFDDEETRAFYCDIPDLLTTIPPALLGISEDEIERRKEVNAKKYGVGGVEEEVAEGDAEPHDVTPTSEAQLDAAEEGEILADDDEDGVQQGGKCL